MSLFTNTAQEETFRLVMDYLVGRRMKVLASNSPSYIRAEIGSYVSMSHGNAKGEVEFNIAKRDGGSYLHFNFSFLKNYLFDLIIAICISPIFYGILLLMLTPFPNEFIQTVQHLIWIITFGFIFTTIGFVEVMSGRNASKTRRMFIEEFNTFMQSLATKKE